MVKKETKIIPDRVIEMEKGDKVNIYIRKRDILFSFYCDGTGNCFAIPKEDLKEMIK
jgi:hypothetical protein